MNGLVGLKSIAEILGKTSNQVYMWHRRRGSNGFPAAVAHVNQPRYPGDNRGAPLFDLVEVLAWWATYDPNANRGAHWAAKRGAA